MSFYAALDRILIVLGVIIAVAPVTLASESWTPVFAALAGVLLIGAGVWKLGSRLLPDRRIYQELRAEVTYFIELVRRLNAHTLRGDDAAVEDLREQMKESVDRMVVVAGKPRLR